jgi:hypothetical protein
MPRGKKFTAEQIIRTLREAEIELARWKTVPKVVRKLGATEQTYYQMEAGVRRSANGPSEPVEGHREGERSAEATPGGC